MTEPLLDIPDATIRALRIVGVVVGVLVAVVGVWERRFGLLDYRPGGTAFGENVLPVLAVGLAVAVAVAFRWEIVGGALAAFLGAGLTAFALHQLVPWHAALLIVGFAIPAMVWLLIDLSELPPRSALWGVGVVAAMIPLGGIVGTYVYDSIWGPTHPMTVVDPLPESLVDWAWAGSATPTSIEIRTQPATDSASVQIDLATDPDFTNAERFASDDSFGSVVGFGLEDLVPATEYHYRFVVNGTVDRVRTGRFRTFPAGPSSFTVAVGSCARVGSNGRVFDTIRETDPDLYMVVGDFHYGDNNRDDIERFREVMDLTLAMPAQASLYRSTPIAYVWDDHDYAGNDSGGDARSRRSAMAAYREYVPSYSLAGEDTAVYQAFTLGRVRFVLTDARAARDIDLIPGTSEFSMLGNAQKAWLKNELVTASQSHELVVWVNPVPWVADPEPGGDHWGGYPLERRELADHIADNDIDNILMVSGDAHMVAIDDGTNTDFSSVGSGGFPLLHAAPLDRPGSLKGGPYSHGISTEGGQFGVIDVIDDGDSLTVTIGGRNWQNEELMTFSFSPSPSTRG